MSTITRIFLIYAAQDAEYRSLLVSAAKAARLPVTFLEMPCHVSDARGRQSLCRDTLQRCSAAIVLVSRHTAASHAVESDVQCVREAGLPLHAVGLGRENETRGLLEGWDVTSHTDWSWPRIASLLLRPDPDRVDPALENAG